MAYHQITREERYTIWALRRHEKSMAEIARTLGRHRSTIHREVRRNCGRADGFYRPLQAHGYALRSALRSIFGSLAAGIAPDQEAITGLNRFVREAQGHMHLVGSGSEYDWEWLVDDDLVRVLWPVARSAAVLLVSEQLSRVRICDADTCRWLFLDTSKSGRGAGAT